MNVKHLWDTVSSAPRMLAGVSLALTIGFFSLLDADSAGSSLSTTKALLGALLWTALGWYIAEHGESRSEQTFGTLNLLAVIAMGVVGLVSNIRG